MNLRVLLHHTPSMLLSIPPRPSNRPRLIPGLSLRAGDVLAGRFRALSLLRADRACAHLAAVHTGTHTRVEIMVLLAMEDAIEAVNLRFLTDARKAASLQGGAIARLLYVGVTEDGHPFVVREQEAEQTLASLLEKMGSLPTENAVDVAIAVCEALQGAHAIGLVHGELAPSMVHLAWTPHGPSKVKVAGLGTSRALGMLPLGGRSVASLARRAPELLQTEREVDARADVWGVGVLLYTMLAGEPPFASDATSTTDVSAALDDAAMIAGVPDGLAEIVEACLARDPALRPQGMVSLQARLALFGSRPIFEKRSSQLVVDTGPYDAIELERLMKEAGPSEPSVVDVDVELDLVVTRPAIAAPSAPPPPVAISIAPAPLAQLAHARPRARRTAALVAACVGLCAAAGAFAWSSASASPTSRAAIAAAAPAPPPADEPLPAPRPAEAPKTEPAPKAPVTFAISDLPAIATTQRSRPAVPVALARTVTPAAPGAPASPAPAVDPIVRSAAAPIQPQPKASDDDLRRFLDDRR
jgi:serine/threonine protein kinase